MREFETRPQCHKWAKYENFNARKIKKDMGKYPNLIIKRSALMNKFNSIRISENNLVEYLHEKYPKATNFVFSAPVRLTQVPQLL